MCVILMTQRYEKKLKYASFSGSKYQAESRKNAIFFAE